LQARHGPSSASTKDLICKRCVLFCFCYTNVVLLLCKVLFLLCYCFDRNKIARDAGQVFCHLKGLWRPALFPGARRVLEEQIAAQPKRNVLVKCIQNIGLLLSNRPWSEWRLHRHVMNNVRW
jgi:hypothetical protein